MRRNLIGLAVVATAAALAIAPAQAAIDSYQTTPLGASEVPGPGVPGGYGIALLAIDDMANPVSGPSWRWASICPCPAPTSTRARLASAAG